MTRIQKLLKTAYTKQYSKEKCAAILDVSINTIDEYENGELELAQSMCDRFKQVLKAGLSFTKKMSPREKLDTIYSEICNTARKLYMQRLIGKIEFDIDKHPQDIYFSFRYIAREFRNDFLLKLYELSRNLPKFIPIEEKLVERECIFLHPYTDCINRSLERLRKITSTPEYKKYRDKRAAHIDPENIEKFFEVNYIEVFMMLANFYQALVRIISYLSNKNRIRHDNHILEENKNLEESELYQKLISENQIKGFEALIHAYFY